MLGNLTKDPNAALDYAIDWHAWLSGDTIATSTWTVPTGITKTSDTHDTTTATVWLSGGSVGQTYQLTNTITTAGGRTDERTFQLTIQDK